MIRFDYRGYGDSQGSFADATASEMIADIEQAIVELKQQAKLDHLALLGIRFGASLATVVAANHDDIKSLILWDPIPNPWKHYYSELRQTVTTQTVLFKEVRITREQLLANIQAGKPSLSDGYNFNFIDEGFPLSAALVQELKELDLYTHLSGIKAQTLIIHLRKKDGMIPKALNDFAQKMEQSGVKCQLEKVIEESIPWKYDMVYATKIPQVYEKTLN